MNINQLRNLTTRTVSMEDLVLGRSQLKNLLSNYEDLGLTNPNWVADKLLEVETEINAQARAERQAEITKLKASLSALMPVDEKRAKLKERLALLETQINPTSTK